MSEPQRATNEPQGDDRIRDLCRQIAEERDPAKVAQLSKALRQLLRVQSDDARLKMEYLAMRYREQIHAVPRIPRQVDDGDSNPYDGESSPAVSRIRALLMFLGLAGTRPAHVPEK
jgi:hypothetical protein